MADRYRLITIGPSHYCEKARWGLDFFRIDYAEERHPPMIHWAWSLPSGGGRTVPILVAGGRVIGESSEILDFLDAEHGGDRRLYPAEAERRRKVEELESRFDARIGPHTRRLVYHHMLPDKELTLRALSSGVGEFQSSVFSAGYPVFRFLMRRGMNINQKSSDRSLEYVRRAFDEVGEQLSDGRDYLVGDAFSAADLTFAALTAPVLLPPNYGAALPAVEELPSEVADIVEGFRTTTAGIYALRVYEDCR